MVYIKSAVGKTGPKAQSTDTLNGKLKTCNAESSHGGMSKIPSRRVNNKINYKDSEQWPYLVCRGLKNIQYMDNKQVNIQYNRFYEADHILSGWFVPPWIILLEKEKSEAYGFSFLDIVNIPQGGQELVLPSYPDKISGPSLKLEVEPSFLVYMWVMACRRDLKVLVTAQNGTGYVNQNFCPCSTIIYGAGWFHTSR